MGCIGGKADAAMPGDIGGEMKYQPLRLRPCYKEYLWGGRRLKTEFNKVDAPDVTAESWELAAHKDGFSAVADGFLQGNSLADLGQMDKPGIWGSDCKCEEFPVMVKLIDAAKDLSIQVHPSDATALPQQGESGKAEMWYIVDCVPNASLYFGFSKKISKDEFCRRAKDGTICEVLNRVSVKKGDVFFILPGTVHAIGAGIVIAEIQQNSNTTFRIYDYQRRDASGNLRPLHLERAAEVLDYTPLLPEECRANNSVCFPEFTLAEMFSCRYFRAYRIDVRAHIDLCCDGRSFQHLLCVDGNGVIRYGDDIYTMCRGDSFLMPAALGEYTIEGQCRVLLSRI